MPLAAWTETAGSAIAEATGKAFRAVRDAGASGGSISQACVLAGDDGRRFFIKQTPARQRPIFETEAAGLGELARCAALRIPRAIAITEHGGSCILVLEYLELGARPDAPALGRGVAALHRISGETFGWKMDNYIGTTPQPNPAECDWPGFYRRHRLAHQRRLAQTNGAPAGLVDAVARIEGDVRKFFPGYRPEPSLLHGDLWSGNWGFVEDGTPAVFDPAVYFGDREADIAMMELFGSPGGEFFAAYEEDFPLNPGYAVRRDLYNLYHILNHFNLFGGGYAGQAERMARRLLAELR